MEKMLAVVRGWHQVNAVGRSVAVAKGSLFGVVGELIFHLDRSEGSPSVEGKGGWR